MKSALYITNRTPLGYFMMIEQLLDAFQERRNKQMVSSPGFFQSPVHRVNHPSTIEHQDVETQTDPDVDGPYILLHGANTTGFFDIHTPSKPVEDYFIALHDSLHRLMSTLVMYNGNCPLCGFAMDVGSFVVVPHGHAARISMNCVAGHSTRWYSSSIIGGKFAVNLR